MIPGIPSSVQVELENSLEHNSLAKFEGVEKSASEISECVCVCARVCVRVCSKAPFGFVINQKINAK